MVSNILNGSLSFFDAKYEKKQREIQFVFLWHTLPGREKRKQPECCLLMLNKREFLIGIHSQINYQQKCRRARATAERERVEKTSSANIAIS